MEKIIEHFGTGLLAGIGALGIFGIYAASIRQGGALYTAVLNFMNSICG